MRYSAYSLIVFIIFSGIFYYLINTLSPWNEAAVNTTVERFGLLTGAEFREFVEEGLTSGTIFNLLNVRNLVILFFIGLIAFVSGFSALHLFFDKLFFKKFYEKPSLFNSIRRGTLLGLVIVIFAVLRLIGALQLYIFLLGVVLILLIEIFFVFFTKRHHKHDEAKPEEIEKEPK